jgi:hypothetical protein
MAVIILGLRMREIELGLNGGGLSVLTGEEGSPHLTPQMFKKY